LAFTASAVLEVESGASDTTGVGVFDPGVSGMDNALSIASANTSAPVVTVTGEAAGDVNMWFYLKSGTSSIPGWYPIVSVDTTNHKYTLNAAIGAAVLANGTLNTAVGCGTAASLTSQTGAVDFSQTTGNITTGTASSAATTLTATTGIFRKVMVGNGVTNGTNWVAITAFTSSTIVTIDSSPAWVAQSISVGGALASPGKAASLQVNGNRVWVKAGTYTVTSASTNIAGGCVSTKGAGDIWSGYSTIRGDDAARPTIISDGVITTFTLVGTGASGSTVRYITADGNSRTSSRGFANLSGNNCLFYRCIGKNCTNSAFAGLTAVTNRAEFCYGTGCSTQPVFSGDGCYYCVADTNTITGFSAATTPAWVGCISSNNTGSTSVHGFSGANDATQIMNCAAYGNAGSGFSLGSSNRPIVLINCLSANNSVWQFTASGLNQNTQLINCAGWNNGGSGTFNSTNITSVFGFVTLTADPFTNAAGGDFSLNNTAGGGASCRAAAIPGAFPGLSGTVGKLDIGAVQHGDPAQSVWPLVAGDLVAV
jgi:hypothetical protein